MKPVPVDMDARTRLLIEAAVRERMVELVEAKEALEKELTARRRAEQAAHGRVEAFIRGLWLLAAAPDRDTFIEQVLKALVEQLGTGSGSFWMYDSSSEASHLLAAVGNGTDSVYESLPEEARAEVEEPALPNALLHYTLVAPGGRSGDRGDSPDSPAPALIRLPLFAEKEFLGSFILCCVQARPYLPEEIEMARAIAQQAVPVIRLTRLADRDRQAAVLEERSLLACEIHDALAQHFAGILLQIGVAQRIVKQQPEEAWELVTQAGILAGKAVEEARRSVWALQPVATEYGDLAGMLSHSVTQMTAGLAIQGAVQVYGTPRLLPPDVGMNLLRIGQEALNNALRHARAQNIFVELTFEPASVRLCIQDDGQGFDPRNQGEGRGFGLLGMQQRAYRIGGNVAISSQPGRGAEVVVTVSTGSAEGQ